MYQMPFRTKIFGGGTTLSRIRCVAWHIEEGGKIRRLSQTLERVDLRCNRDKLDSPVIWRAQERPLSLAHVSRLTQFVTRTDLEVDVYAHG
jgi:hypothetical protein